MKRKKYWLLILVVLFAIALSSDRCLARGQGRFHSETHGYSLTIPEGWIQIPKDVFKVTIAKTKQAFPNSKTYIYDSAFQTKEYSQWFAGPRIIIQIGTETINEEEIKGLVETLQIKDVSSKLENPNFLKTLKVGEKAYDFDKHILYMRLVGVEEMLLVVCYTSKGFIEFHCIAGQEDLNKYLPVFCGIINSLTLDSQYKYHKDIGFFERSAMEALPIMVLVLIVAGIAAAGGYVSSKIKQYKDKKDQGLI